MILAKCLRKLPINVCENIKDIIQHDTEFFSYDKKQNKIYLDEYTLLNYFNDTVDSIKTLIILFNPQIEIQMHHGNRVESYDGYIFFESNLPCHILEEWYEILPSNKIVFSWNSKYF